ncbi:hypothetical protein F7R05_07475 [Pseudomonas koreensis]|nr:hypothetical protein F7R05_07475 [Pseudomonas koreensis]
MVTHGAQTGLLLWRGSLLPLGCAAAPNLSVTVCLRHRVSRFATAAQSSGSKLPRHRGFQAAGLSRVPRRFRRSAPGEKSKTAPTGI